MENMFGRYFGRDERIAKLVAQGLTAFWEKSGKLCDSKGNPIIMCRWGVAAVCQNESWRIVHHYWGTNKLRSKEWAEVFVPIVYMIAKDDGRNPKGPEIGRDIMKVIRDGWMSYKYLVETGRILVYQDEEEKVPLAS